MYGPEHGRILTTETTYGEVLREGRITPVRPRVEFGDGVAESEQATATTLDLLASAGAVSTATKVKILLPEWDDAAV
ncbi:hypothetical protein GCM10010272_65390 [Streptomyces lateritius]|nr:hypothetical protein GCM10010272_65390 [Streptomyces lateritius]